MKRFGMVSDIETDLNNINIGLFAMKDNKIGVRVGDGNSESIICFFVCVCARACICVYERD